MFTASAHIWKAWLQSFSKLTVLMEEHVIVVMSHSCLPFYPVLMSQVILTLPLRKNRVSSLCIGTGVVTYPIMNGQIGGWMYERVCGWLGEWLEERKFAWIGERLEDQMDEWSNGWINSHSIERIITKQMFESAYFLMLRLKSCYQSVLQYLSPESMSMEQLEICVVDPTEEPERRRKIWPQHLAAILGKVSYCNYLFCCCRRFTKSH